MVTKEEQNAVLKSQIAAQEEEDQLKPKNELVKERVIEEPNTPGPKSAPEKLDIDSPSQRPVSSARLSVDGQSEISLLPPQNIEKKINEVENLKW